MVFNKILLNRDDERRRLFDKWCNLLMSRIDVFSIIAPLPEFEGLIESASECFREKAAFNEVLVEVGEDAGML